MTQDRNAQWIIQGGRPLTGEYPVQTAKNSALYLILASLLTEDEVVLHRVPQLSDMQVGYDILEHLGVEVRHNQGSVSLRAQRITTSHAPFRLVRKMRASFVAMGALLGRVGEARIGVPGGCAFGPRPVDRHVAAFEALGVQITEDEGDFVATTRGPLEGHVTFEAPTVGGTQNVLLASARGSRKVVIENAALEPEVADLIDLLNLMGARIQGKGTSVLTVDGVPELHGAAFTPIADRIEAGTLLMAIAATRGTGTVTHVRPDHLTAVLTQLEGNGVLVTTSEDAVHVDASGPLQTSNLTARPYPGFPTDLQAPYGAFLATIPGRGTVKDDVYPDRFTHASELQKLGATVTVHGREMNIDGGTLMGSDVHAADIRAGGALVVAALAAQGQTNLTGIEYLDRGYERFEERLSQLNADVKRVDAAEAKPLLYA
jgi:UDP-N-acetylglucosamine 1-carboxyvinyltransferase